MPVAFTCANGVWQSSETASVGDEGSDRSWPAVLWRAFNAGLAEYVAGVPGAELSAVTALGLPELLEPGTWRRPVAVTPPERESATS